MGKLMIEEVIGHCERTVERFEKKMSRATLEKMPLEEIFMKEYWEHRQVAEWLKELQAFKDKLEQGLLIELPCKVGDTVWFIGKKCKRCEEDDCYGCSYGRNGNQKDERFLYKMTVKQFRIRNNIIYFTDTNAVWASKETEFCVNDIGKTVFLTRSEAEEALAKMGGE